MFILGGSARGWGTCSPQLGLAAPHPASIDLLSTVVRLADMLGHELYLDSCIEITRYLIK